jgi:hypothetical protein
MKSSITVLINSHGEDLLTKPIVANKNVRILSYAGKTGCVGFNGLTTDKLPSLIRIIEKFKDENPENESTYCMLKYIADAERDDYKTSALSSISKYNKLTEVPMYLQEYQRTQSFLENNNYLSIITPIIDQKYTFYDKRHSFSKTNDNDFGIYVLDVKNAKDIGLKPGSRGDSRLKPGSIIKDILIPNGTEKVLDFDNNTYIDADKLSVQELSFRTIVTVKQVLLSELIHYLMVDNGFDIVNIVHKTCRTSDIFNKKLMKKRKKRENIMSLKIDKFKGGKKTRKYYKKYYRT